MGLNIAGLNRAIVAGLLIFASLLSFAQNNARQDNPQILLKTDLGNIHLELYPKQAPVTVANFLGYIDNFYYAGTIFHRVVPGFVIQAGGYGFDLFPREPGEPIANESNNGLKNLRGTIAMARLPEPDSARAQFYINLSNNRNLDPQKDKPGYTVFGKVIGGMEIADKISRQPTKRSGIFTHLPKTPVRILGARRIKAIQTKP